MPISYSPANNWITITGFTLIAPCTFTDIYNADKAGTYSLHDRNGIAGVDGAAVAVTNALRPTDYIILGGVSGDLYITITNWNLMTNATIRVTGTDRDGAAQTDDVVVNANGNFNTAKWFRTVTHTQVTVFNTPGGGSFDYELWQGQWGVVWRLGADQFRSQARWNVGDGFIATWVQDAGKQIFFDSHASTINIRVYGDGYFQAGALVNAANKIVQNGCAFLTDAATENLLIHFAAASQGYLYGCLFVSLDNDRVRVNAAAGSSGRVWHCGFLLNCELRNLDASWDLFDLYISSVAEGMEGVSAVLDDARIENCTRAVILTGAADVTTRNVTARSNPTLILFFVMTGDLYAIDWDADVWALSFGAGSTGIVYRQYSFDLRAVDSDGVGIQNVTVSMVDRLGAAVFNVNTDVNGDIATQTITYGYYDIANGNIIQPGGLGYSPHTVTISLAGYITRTIVFTMDRQREEIEELLPKGPRKDIEGGLYMEINSAGDLLKLS